MLDRYIFIGTGGSGGRTLRYLRSEIKRRLANYGYYGKLPDAWQFLHVDVPAKPDVEDAGDGEYIQYLALTIGGEMYRKFDSQVALRGEACSRNFAGWRPDPARLPIDPDHGAGQYRAAGRVIEAAAIDRLVTKLREVVHNTRNADSGDLTRISAAMGDSNVDTGRVWTVIVSSLGGGSGAGTYLDVCDILRMLDGAGVNDSIAFLYTPDIFEDISTQAKKALDPNSLAAVSELIAATWNSERPEPGEFALITTPDVLVKSEDIFRGPRRTFIISRTNGKVTLHTQRDVYRATAAALGSWVTEPKIQDHFSAITTGDWDAFGRPTDRSGMTEGETQPFNSIGYASLSLGRERFAVYASQRFAGELASHLLFGHRSHGSDRSDTVILEELAEGYRDIFLREAGLMEFGPTNNQILDALRGGDFRSIAEPLAASEKKTLLDTVTAGRRDVERDHVRSALTTSVQNRRPAFVEELRFRRESNATRWVEEIQGTILSAMNRSLVHNGGRGTVAVMELAVRHLRGEVVVGLREEASTLRRQAQSKAGAGLNAIFAGAAKKLLADDSRFKQVVEGALNQWIGESEDALSTLAATLLSDLLDHFVEPLIAALKRGLHDLEGDWQGQPGKPGPLPRWALGGVGDDLIPMEYETFLEPYASWPDIYESLAQKQTNSRFAEEAKRALISEILTSHDRCVRQIAAWSPASGILSTRNGPSTAAFVFQLRAIAVKELADQQLRSPGGEFQRFVKEPISEWLAPGRVLDDARLSSFLAGLADTLRKSEPLVNLDRHVLATLYGGTGLDELTRLLTPIPLDQSHPASASIERLLAQDFGFRQIELDSIFDADHQAPSLDVVTTLQGPVSPLAITSLTAPLASAFQAQLQQLTADELNRDDFWFARRARPLMAFLPIPPHLRRALLRGWMVGRALGYVDIDELDRPKIWDGQRWYTFTTLLGRRPEQARHVLPSILEGLPLALVLRPGDDEVWKPYKALGDLGNWTRYDRKELQPSRALADWLQTGELKGGAVAQTGLGSATTSNGRAEAVDGWLAKTIKDYEVLNGRTPGTAWQKQDRAWEIAEPLIDALGQIRSWMAETILEEDGPEA